MISTISRARTAATIMVVLSCNRGSEAPGVALALLPSACTAAAVVVIDSMYGVTAVAIDADEEPSHAGAVRSITDR